MLYLTPARRALRRKKQRWQPQRRSAV